MLEAHKWESPDRLLTVYLPIRVLKKICRLCTHHLNTETGGILVGQYSADGRIAKILNAYPPPNDSVFGKWWFVRGTIGLAVKLIQLWESKNRQYYIGEWHYHPSCDVSPSDTDIQQMIAIANSNNYKCDKPILLIIGPKGTSFPPAVSITVFPNASAPIVLSLPPAT